MDIPEPIFLKDAVVFDGTGQVLTHSGVLLSGGRIHSVGKYPVVARRARAIGARQIDLDGGFIMPGIVDAHIHTVELGESMERIDLFDCRSAAECVAKLVARSVDVPIDKWVLARGWRKSIWDVDAFPTARMIDAKLPDRPVLCISFDGHCVWVNSKAMELAGITSGTEDPAGGEVSRDEFGKPIGIFKEAATSLVRRLLPKPSDEQRRNALLVAQKHLNTLGITEVHNLGHFNDYELARKLQEAGELTIRFAACCRLEDEGCGRADVSSNHRDFVRLVGIKTFLDGTLNTQTAYMYEPFLGVGSCGIMTQSTGQLRQTINRARELGLPVFVHAIGDRAVSEALDAIEEAGDPALGYRIEHAACISAADVKRMSRLRIVASMQPAHLLTDMRTCRRYLGNRSCRVYVFRDLLQAGVTLAFGSDAPVVSADSRQGIFAAVSRRGLDGEPEEGWYPQQALTVAEALAGFCRGPALSLGNGEVLGKVGAGFEADLTVLAENPLELAPSELLSLTVRMTIAGGKLVYEAD